MRICCLFIFPLCGWVGGFFPAAVIFRGLGGGRVLPHRSIKVKVWSRQVQKNYRILCKLFYRLKNKVINPCGAPTPSTLIRPLSPNSSTQPRPRYRASDAKKTEIRKKYIKRYRNCSIFYRPNISALT